MMNAQRLIQKNNSDAPRKIFHAFNHASIRSIGALACLAPITLLLASCGSGGSSSTAPAPITSSAAIWFHPESPMTSTQPNEPPVSGESDFYSVFQDSAPWPRVLANTRVIGLYAGWIASVDAHQLQSIVAFLNAHNLGIEIEAPAMQAQSQCGSGVEGYVPYGSSLHDFTLAYLQRLKALDAQVLYIKVDEPFYFGNIVQDPRSCHFSVTQVASEVGQYVQLVHTVYPNVAIGDVEPIVDGAYPGGVVSAIGQWHDTYKSVSGSAFPFFFADIDFNNPVWPTLVKKLEDDARLREMKFGIIYIGDETDTSDQQWATKTVARFQSYQGQSGGQPDYVLFQSWQPHPQLCLPESDPITFTGVINAYISTFVDGTT